MNSGNSAYSVSDTVWSESGITWNNKPARGGALGSVTVSGNAYTSYELDVSAYVIAEKAAGRNTVSFALHNPATSSQAIWIQSRESGAGGPQLVITPNAAPTASITAPVNNAVFIPPANVTVTANAADSDGSIAKVEFFDGATLVATDTTAPFSTTLTNLAAGTHALTARATDNLGLATTSAVVTIRVDASPAVSITAPAANSVFTPPANITLSAAATDPDGSVTKVDFYDGATLLGTAAAAPYSLALTNVAAGTHSYTARATDNDGAVTTSAAVPVRVDALPSISITSPANNTVFSAPASFSLTAAAADTDGTVARVDFYQGATLIGTASASPYSAAVSNLASGAYSFTAVATDNDGAQTTSSAVAITVNALPTASLASPANNATFSAPASVPLAAQVADTDGTIARVEFYYGTTLITTLTAAPYSFTWSGVPAGAYSLTARAIDNLGGTVTSAAVNITVNTAAAQLYFIHTDNLNTPRLVADATGTTVWRWDQTEPFGDSVPDENPSGFGNFELPLGMPGQYRDKETGIWQNWMRDYSANLGRYVESDPVGIRAGLNTYSYVFNTPLAATDVYGLRSQYADTDPYPQCGNDAMCRAGIPTPPPEEKPTPVPCKGKWIELPFTRDIGYQFTLNCTCHFSCSCPSGDAFPDPNPGQYTTSGKLIYTGRDPKKGDQCICPKPGPETR